MATKSIALAATLRGLGHHQFADELHAAEQASKDVDLRLVVFGEYSSGKSTFINAIIGRRLLASRLRPTTGVPTEVRHGPNVARIIMRNGSEQSVSLDEIDDYASLDLESRARDDVERIVVRTDCDVLRHNVAFIDTPGLLDDDRQTERALREVVAADVVLLVVRADRALGQREQQFAIDYLTERLGKFVIVIVNGMGLTDASGRDELIERVALVTDDLVSPTDFQFYEIDALPALRRELGVGDGTVSDDDFDEFRDELRLLDRRSIGAIKASAQQMHRTALEHRIRAENDRLIRRLSDERDALERDRRAEVDVARSLRTRFAQLRRGSQIELSAIVDKYRANGPFDVLRGMLDATALKSKTERVELFHRLAERFRTVLDEIDEQANVVLFALSDRVGVPIEPLSLTELAELDAADHTIDETDEAAGLTLGLGTGLVAVLLVGAGPFVAIPLAIAGYLFGRKSGASDSQVVEFQKSVRDEVERRLSELSSALDSQAAARVDAMATALAARVRAAEKRPPPNDELRVRIALQKELSQ